MTPSNAAQTASEVRHRRAMAVLRDVIRSGGTDNWSHLKSHGHSFSTVWSCVRQGWLAADGRYRYALTETGHGKAA